MSTTTKTYQASRIKRQRATEAEMEERRDALFEIISEQKPMTVRQVFYQATVQGIIDKTESGYEKIQVTLVRMRRDGMLSYSWIVDNTRRRIDLEAYSGIEDALHQTARFYRRKLWSGMDCYVEIWLEKDALAGVIEDVTLEYDVPLMVARGYPSLSFLHQAAQVITAQGKPTFIYHLGDYDPSGVNAGERIEEDLLGFAPDVEIHFERIAVTPEQIAKWDLPTRPTKSSDTRSKAWTGGDSVELDAISPDDLRDLVRDFIEVHMPPEQLEILRVAEASERDALYDIAAEWLEREDE